METDARASAIHSRLLALARDPELPSWCRWSVALGFAIPGPLDELVIYPAVLGFVWLRRRHVLERHGFAGLHALAALGTALVVGACLGLAAEMVAGVLS